MVMRLKTLHRSGCSRGLLFFMERLFQFSLRFTQIIWSSSVRELQLVYLIRSKIHAKIVLSPNIRCILVSSKMLISSLTHALIHLHCHNLKDKLPKRIDNHLAMLSHYIQRGFGFQIQPFLVFHFWQNWT